MNKKLIHFINFELFLLTAMCFAVIMLVKSMSNITEFIIGTIVGSVGICLMTYAYVNIVIERIKRKNEN